jgi:transposase-like protein
VSVYSEALGAAICARVAGGESMSAICEEAGMPDRHTLNNWARAHPAFAAALKAARLRARTEARLADRAALAAREARDRRGRPSTYNLAVAQVICERLANGETLTAIGRDPTMPGFGTILGWVKRHPEFEAMYVQARQMFADYLLDQARDGALASTHATVWSDRLRFDTIRWMTARMAPRKYCERLVVDAEVSARRRDEALEDEDRGGGAMTVIVKRFSEVTAEDEAAADLTEAHVAARAGRIGGRAARR